MGRPILRTNILRDSKKLYYCSTDEDGYILICEADLMRKGRPKKEKGNEDIRIV